ncbi:kinase D-interacting substrate of 220 kDa [Striga asiatica]|uniref:Kinase D-interacting substrate of 220 kDa n=1 Tax=Striga asiatica TaxID=4170 RepID=A0A5A7PZ16_STRAF|nr:kinase D-interacting substrate of 220 kDa [Striga asiatica]
MIIALSPFCVGGATLLARSPRFPQRSQAEQVHFGPTRWAASKYITVLWSFDHISEGKEKTYGKNRRRKVGQHRAQSLTQTIRDQGALLRIQLYRSIEDPDTRGKKVRERPSSSPSVQTMVSPDLIQQLLLSSKRHVDSSLFTLATFLALSVVLEFAFTRSSLDWSEVPTREDWAFTHETGAMHATERLVHRFQREGYGEQQTSEVEVLGESYPRIKLITRSLYWPNHPVAEITERERVPNGPGFQRISVNRSANLRLSTCQYQNRCLTIQISGKSLPKGRPYFLTIRDRDRDLGPLPSANTISEICHTEQSPNLGAACIGLNEGDRTASLDAPFRRPFRVFQLSLKPVRVSTKRIGHLRRSAERAATLSFHWGLALAFGLFIPVLRLKLLTYKTHELLSAFKWGIVWCKRDLQRSIQVVKLRRSSRKHQRSGQRILHFKISWARKRSPLGK